MHNVVLDIGNTHIYSSNNCDLYDLNKHNISILRALTGYKALAILSHGGYDNKSLFCILLIQLYAIQNERHHTTGPLYTILKK